MCKILAITDTRRLRVDTRTLSAIRSIICRSDPHGFGYSLLSRSGEIAGERTIRPANFTPLDSGGGSRSRRLPIMREISGTYGNLRDAATNHRALIAHGRYSTNSISLANTHPYVSGDGRIALIHNGVVADEDGYAEGISETDNDTEILLHYWTRGGMADIEQYVSGYYAMAVLDGSGLLHIVRDDRAMLYMSWSAVIQSYVISTTTDILSAVSRVLRLRLSTPDEILPNTYAIFRGNKLVSHRGISPRQRSARSLSHISDDTLAMSLGTGESDSNYTPMSRMYRSA